MEREKRREKKYLITSSCFSRTNSFYLPFEFLCVCVFVARERQTISNTYQLYKKIQKTQLEKSKRKKKEKVTKTRFVHYLN